MLFHLFCMVDDPSIFLETEEAALTAYDRKRRIFRLFALTLIVLIGVGGIGLLLSRLGIGIPCFFYKVTGLRCPGCGNTRAVLSLLRLDFGAALRYNWLFPVEFLYLGWIFVSSGVSYIRNGKFTYQSPRNGPEIGLMIVVAGWFVVRNILHI